MGPRVSGPVPGKSSRRPNWTRETDSERKCNSQATADVFVLAAATEADGRRLRRVHSRWGGLLEIGNQTTKISTVSAASTVLIVLCSGNRMRPGGPGRDMEWKRFFISFRDLRVVERPPCVLRVVG